MKNMIIGTSLLESNLFLSSIITLFFALLIFIGSFIFHIDKLVVIYPLSILCTCITIFSLSQHVSFHTILALTLTIICAIRLFVHLSLRIFKDKKDRRFNEVRDNVVLRGVFSFIVWLYSICSLSFVCTCCSFEEKKTLFNGIDITGLLLWLGGFMLETIGDLHLFVFKHKVMNYGLICNRGLFKVMRHPNYVGSTFWMTGLALACWNGCNGKGWIPLICSFTFCIGTNFLTGIPPAERALHSHYGNEIQYHLYVSATSIFIPVVPVIEHTMQWIRRRPQNIPPPAEAAAHPISPSLSSTSPILTPTHLQAERDLQNSPPSLFDSSSYSPAPPADVSTPPEINISPSYFRPHDSMHRPNEMKYPPSNNEDQKQDPFENKFQKQDGAGLSLLNP